RFLLKTAVSMLEEHEVCGSWRKPIILVIDAVTQDESKRDDCRINFEKYENTSEDVIHRRLDPLNNVNGRSLEAYSNQQYFMNMRRGSMPSDLSSEFKRQSVHDGRNSDKSTSSGKSRVRKNLLRRRSSGGPEMFASSNLEPYGDGMTGQRWRREVLARRTAEQVLVRRRGSLPIEVLAATHSGVLV
ncbi:hypothetical protein L9F63_012386, partial [Diploptera punctata]